MIISKPQPATIISFSLFIIITLVVLVMNVKSVIISGAWYNYLMIVLLVPIAFLVLYRIFIRYQVVKLGNNQIQIYYPVFRKTFTYPLKELKSWRETAVSTGKNSSFKELGIEFSDSRKVYLAAKEHTDYIQVIKYLTQKAASKKVS